MLFKNRAKGILRFVGHATRAEKGGIDHFRGGNGKSGASCADIVGSTDQKISSFCLKVGQLLRAGTVAGAKQGHAI